jgi:hypothetical protein
MVDERAVARVLEVLLEIARLRHDVAGGGAPARAAPHGSWIASHRATALLVCVMRDIPSSTHDVGLPCHSASTPRPTRMARSKMRVSPTHL